MFNTIKLYAKQRRLISLVADQIYEKEKNNRMMVGILSQIVEFRNGESGPHVLHIQTLTRLLLERLVQKTGQYGLSWSEQYMISMASALHDIGKIGIDEKILNKPGKLTKEEFDIMKTHTLIGATMLENLKIYCWKLLIRSVAGTMNVMMEKDIRMGLWERKFQFLLRSYHWRMPMMR